MVGILGFMESDLEKKKLEIEKDRGCRLHHGRRLELNMSGCKFSSEFPESYQSCKVHVSLIPICVSRELNLKVN